MKTPPKRAARLTRRGFIQTAAAAGVALATRGVAAPAAETPTAPSVAALASNLPFRLATAGSYLAARIDVNETTLLIASRSGNQSWLHNGNFDIEVGSEVMGVTAITAIAGTPSPQLFTVTRSPSLATAHAPGTSVQIVDTANL